MRDDASRSGFLQRKAAKLIQSSDSGLMVRLV